MKKFIAALAALLALVMMLASCNLFINTGLHMEIYANEDKYSIGDFEYDAENIKAVDIEWIFGNVTIIPTMNEKLSVNENADNIDDDLKMRYFIDGSTLRIKFCKSGLRRTMTESAKKALTVEIPDNISLKVNTVSSDVSFGASGQTLHSLRLDFTYKKIEIETVSGKIDFSDLGQSGAGDYYVMGVVCDELALSSISGKISAEIFECNNAKVESTSGSVNVAGIIKTLNAKSVSGSMNFNVWMCTSAKIESVSGNIETSGSITSLTAKAISGDIEATAKFEEADLSATSGDITIGDFDGALEFNTTSGKLKSDIPHTENGKKYIFGNGSQTAKVSTVSGNLIIGE